jgi:hypothetical protein
MVGQPWQLPGWHTTSAFLDALVCLNKASRHSKITAATTRLQVLHQQALLVLPYEGRTVRNGSLFD